MRIHADPDLDPQPWKESLPGVEVVLCVGLGISDLGHIVSSVHQQVSNIP